METSNNRTDFKELIDFMMSVVKDNRKAIKRIKRGKKPLSCDQFIIDMRQHNTDSLLGSIKKLRKSDALLKRRNRDRAKRRELKQAINQNNSKN